MTRSHTHRITMGAMAMASLAFLVGQPVLAHASAVGSPASILEQGEWIWGAQADTVWEWAMDGGAKASMVALNHYRGYGLTDRISIYGSLGWGAVRLTGNTGNSSFRTNLAAGGAIKAKLWQNHRKDWEWDGSIQYLYLGAPHKRRGNQATWKQWQFATCVAKAFGRFKPYAGVKWSLMTLDYKLRRGETNTAGGTLRPTDLIGPFLGCDWRLGKEDHASLNLETSFVSGLGVSLAFNWKF